MPDLMQILTGFGSVAVIITIGWLVGRAGVLGKSGGYALNMVVYWVAMPCMLLHTLATSDTGAALGSAFAVAAGSALTVAAIYMLIARPLVGQQEPERVVGAMSSSYNNVANLGIPIATAVLHDATAIVPALIFQIAFYAPICLTVLDILTSRHGRLDLRRTLMTPLKNPIFVGAALGLAAGTLPDGVPTVLASPIGLLGQAAVPMALLAFGIGLHGAAVLRKGTSPRRAVVLSSVLKNLGQPLMAWFIASVLLGMEGHALLAAVVIAALPTAQNVYTFSSRFGRGTVQARDSAVVTTLACVPVVLVIALLLG
ncbi:AEC family transporter [Corynebacterium freneyi]|uniref:Permease n=1 Tax=Corynebacterium freneyi TaxID=134034 RepID=A0ABS4U586_9CORY|nr:AEC family transporter [Corynebacterium freneyi]MBP2331827.1 putative permease [Corynebacterium freneyi]QXA53893.1 AEC family transporter [Corynebacterium freneyi]WJZ06052.1 Membrane transport protein [Corynebacterium freneyi]